jgi:hypothetical protein
MATNNCDWLIERTDPQLKYAQRELIEEVKEWDLPEDLSRLEKQEREFQATITKRRDAWRLR